MSSQDIPRHWRLHLPGHGVTLEAPPDRSLLQSMWAAGVDWPASCRNGTCRACLGQLTGGTVRHGIDWPGLLPEERAGGGVLPCVAFATSDVTLVPPRD